MSGLRENGAQYSTTQKRENDPELQDFFTLMRSQSRIYIEPICTILLICLVIRNTPDLSD
jgi:hypothetical protein